MEKGEKEAIIEEIVLYLEGDIKSKKDNISEENKIIQNLRKLHKVV
jgi:hypothetical protein